MAAYGQGQKNTTMLGGGKENKRKENSLDCSFLGFCQACHAASRERNTKRLRKIPELSFACVALATCSC